MELSIIVPTYNEKENVELLVEEIRRVLTGTSISYEIIFVDDSSDDTPQILQSLSEKCTEVSFIHRSVERGLASAIVAGFSLSKREYMIVMDADLQHPPVMIPLMVQRLQSADIIIPSRFIAGGSDGGLKGIRKWISWLARVIGKMCIRKLRGFSDCTGGYFALRRSVIKGIPLNPIGWKILMEILVKGKYEIVHEIPYEFRIRKEGVSKMGIKEAVNYLLHIVRLIRSSPDDFRLYKFCAIGALGVIVNLFALTILINIFNLDIIEASFGASVIALLHNYCLNVQITWRDCHRPVIWRHALQFPQFAAICTFGITITCLFVQYFQFMNWNIYLGQLGGILIGAAWSYTANNRWTWGRIKTNDIAGKKKMKVTQEYPNETS